MSKFTFYFVLFWFLALIISLAVNAATLRGNKDSCVDLGRLVTVAGEARDSGATWDQIQVRLAEMIANARKNPASYIQNDADAAFVIKSMSRLWSDKSEPSYITATRIYHICMAKET